MVHLLVRDDNNQWHELIITADAEIDYNVENPLFTEGESYTLDIDLPYENDKNKILRDPRTKWHGKLVLDSIVKTGYIYVTSKKRATVSVQFVEKRPSDIFDETYINIMSLPNYHTDVACRDTYGPDTHSSVRLPWYDNTAQVYHPCVWTLSEPTNLFEGMPFLIKLTRDILERLGFYVDLDQWNNTTFRYLISCNVIPRSWGFTGGYENALPNWTVREFLTQLGYILHGKFIIDDEHMSVTFKFDGSVQHNLPANKLEVFDDYEMTVEDVTDCKYDSAKNIRFADLEDDDAGKYYSCDDEVKMLVQKHGKSDIVIPGVKEWLQISSFLPYDDIRSHRLFFDRTSQRYLIPLFKTINDVEGVTYKIRYKVLNIFAPVVRNESEDFEEVKFVPVSADWLPEENMTGDYIRLSPKKNEEAEDSEVDHRCPAIENAFNNAIESDGKVEYYKKIFVGFWYIDPDASEDHPDDDESVFLDYGDTAVPAVSRIKIVSGGFIKLYESNYDLSLGDNLNITGDRKVEKIDPECLYKYSFLSKDIPDPSALFIIRGEKYVCKKLNIVFNANGMSERIEGEFYKVV